MKNVLNMGLVDILGLGVNGPDPLTHNRMLKFEQHYSFGRRYFLFFWPPATNSITSTETTHLVQFLF